MDHVRKQIRQRLQLEQMMGAASLPKGELQRRPCEQESPPPLANQEQPSDDVRDALAELNARSVVNCRKCHLHQTRTNTVFGEGNPKASIVFVGEAPGADEDRQGRPFVGRAGQLLNDIIIKGMRMAREDVYICNVLKCRPPENRTPTPAEMADCIGYLLDQLNLIRPKVIVALGAVAAQGLLQTTESVGRLRGTVHQFPVDPLSEPIPLIVTYHPAYLLRSYTPENRRKVWQDIQEAMKIAGI